MDKTVLKNRVTSYVVPTSELHHLGKSTAAQANPRKDGFFTMTDHFNIYQDISTRTGGDIYIGVVGPVRTGKSTFIKNFMDLLILPGITDENERKRTIDQLPQSSNGKTIMTTEPKFIPKDAVDVHLEEDHVHFRAKMIDCVGYLIPGALGTTEEGQQRMVKTPWSTQEMPFSEAAELGTHKVISEHSTIGIVLTTDGSVTDLPRDEYLQAEERVIRELHALGKPFVVLLNTSRPKSEDTLQLCTQLSEVYTVPVLPINAQQLRLDDVQDIVRALLEEFPVHELQLFLPHWMETLPSQHFVKQALLHLLRRDDMANMRLRQVQDFVGDLQGCEFVKKVSLEELSLGTGQVRLQVTMQEGLFYQILSETTGLTIKDDRELFSMIQELSDAKKHYDKLRTAYMEAMNRGYGIVNPLMDELNLDAPAIVKQGGKYGVKIKAKAPSIHLIRTDVETEINPFVGTEQQSEDFVAYLQAEMEKDPEQVWDSEIFGKSLFDLVHEGLQNKIVKMPEDAQMKLQHTLERIINEGRGSLICIIL